MGAGSKRKQSDKPIIRTPKAQGGVGTGGRPEQVASMCPLSFEQKVVNSNFTKEGAVVQLSPKDNGYSMDVFGNSIGLLNARFTTMVKECEKMGIHYKGEVVTKKDETYARFFRAMD